MQTTVVDRQRDPQRCDPLASHALSVGSADTARRKGSVPSPITVRSPRLPVSELNAAANADAVSPTGGVGSILWALTLQSYVTLGQGQEWRAKMLNPFSFISDKPI